VGCGRVTRAPVAREGSGHGGVCVGLEFVCRLVLDIPFYVLSSSSSPFGMGGRVRKEMRHRDDDEEVIKLSRHVGRLDIRGELELKRENTRMNHRVGALRWSRSRKDYCWRSMYCNKYLQHQQTPCSAQRDDRKVARFALDAFLL
jgi:hypothetical protein